MDLITLLLIIVSSINVILGLLVILSAPRSQINRIYLINVITIIFWAICIIFYRLADGSQIVVLTKTLYVSATLIASSFLYFTYLFPKDENLLSFSKKAAIIIPNIIIICLTVFGNTIIDSAEVRVGSENIIIFGKLYFLYAIFILFYFNVAFYRLFKKFKATSNLLEKRQIIYLLVGYELSGVIAFATNLILPWFGYFAVNWMGQISTVLMVTCATYSIFKHQLFSVKVVAAELFTILLWIFIFIRVLLSESLREQILNGGLLFFALIIGVTLIRSVIKEVEVREKIELLARDLETANNQKSEFLSFASHEIRNPITAMKGYASLILEGDLGPVSEEVRDATEKILVTGNEVVSLISQYLNKSKVELGQIQYSFSSFNIADVVEQIVKSFGPNIDQKKGLTISFKKIPENADFTVIADVGKIKEVIINLIDNSIKYTPKGSVNVSISRSKTLRDPQNGGAGEKILIKIADTGVGIKKDVIPHLFQKFSRADAAKVNILGTGLGLFLAHEFVTAHKGRVWVESEGDGKGSQFYIELPAATPGTILTSDIISAKPELNQLAAVK